MLNIADMAQAGNSSDTSGINGGGDTPFSRLVALIAKYIPAVSDIFLTVAVLALVICFGMLTVSGQQKVQQIKGHLLRIMFGAAGVLAASYIIGFFAKAGGTTVGAGGYTKGAADGTIMAPAKFYLSSMFPSLM